MRLLEVSLLTQSVISRPSNTALRKVRIAIHSSELRLPANPNRIGCSLILESATWPGSPGPA
jgi:hypothetical protein